MVWTAMCWTALWWTAMCWTAMCWTALWWTAMCSVAGFCDRGNEPSGYTKGRSFLTSWGSQEDARFLQLVLLCACVTTYLARSPGFLEMAK